MANNLNQLVDKLAEELEDKPDKWFTSPRGWLFKPSFTRSQQDREPGAGESTRRSSTVGALSGLKAMVKGSVGSTYNKRWFTLNMERRFMIYYKDDSVGSVESGYIDISRIIDVQISQMADAPAFCIDLVSKEKYYTVAAENQATMIRWVYAINACRPQEVNRPISSKYTKNSVAEASVLSRGEKWTRYDYTYQNKGPLMLNVMGTTNKDAKTGKIINNWIIVTSFEPTTDGKPGRSEATGLISVKDYLVAVNGIDLMKYTFNESMEIINRATFPKTVQFLRDNTSDRQMSRAEGWAVVYYPSLNRRRRRYVDVRWDSINFRKPAPGGSANAQRDAFITLDQIASIKPIIDKSMPSDQQYILRLVCKPDASIDHVGDDDTSLGTSPAAYIDLCFAKDTQMKNWRSVLVSPSIYSSSETSGTIPIHDVEIIESNSVALTKEITNMAIKSDLTGHFAPREFSVVNGSLHWVRIGQKMQPSRQRGIEIANLYSCNLKSVRAVEFPAHKSLSHRFQLILEAQSKTVTVGLKDEISLVRWLDCIREIVAQAPEASKEGMYFSSTIEKEVSAPSEDEDDELVSGMKATGIDGTGNGLQGYLYKKSTRMLSTNNSIYRRRWFVLHENLLTWYKTSGEVENGVAPQGSIDLRSAYEVRESDDSTAPENSIDIVSNEKVLTIAAVDEGDFTLWLDALSDTLEVREMAIQRDGFNGGSKGDKAHRLLSKEGRKAERIAAIRSSVVFSGALMIKSMKESMFKSAWKDRYFVIASGALTYYADQNDLFDLDKDCKGEIALANITSVESTADPKYRSESVFDVHARVMQGGDSNGLRIFTFDARSVDNAEKWMRELCKATEILELKKSPRGVYSSAVSEKMIQARNTKRLMINPGVVATANPVTAGNQFRASLALQSDVDDAYLGSGDQGSVDADGTPSKSVDSQGGPNSPMSNGRNSVGRGGKRGGMGRGVDFRAGSSQSVPLVRQRSDSRSDKSNSVSGDVKAPGECYSDAYGNGGI